jgi:hypothetical protein
VTDGLSLPPVQARMWAVLRDGQPHTPEELHACLYDERGAASNIRAHLTAIRRELRARGETVKCVIHRRRACYQWVGVRPRENGAEGLTPPRQ